MPRSETTRASRPVRGEHGEAASRQPRPSRPSPPAPAAASTSTSATAANAAPSHRPPPQSPHCPAQSRRRRRSPPVALRRYPRRKKKAAASAAPATRLRAPRAPGPARSCWRGVTIDRLQPLHQLGRGSIRNRTIRLAHVHLLEANTLHSVGSKDGDYGGAELSTG